MNSPKYLTNGKVNNNDSLETAIAKLQNQQSNIHLSLPNEWKPETVANQNISAGDSYDLALGKIQLATTGLVTSISFVHADRLCAVSPIS